MEALGEGGGGERGGGKGKKKRETLGVPGELPGSWRPRGGRNAKEGEGNCFPFSWDIGQDGNELLGGLTSLLLRERIKQHREVANNLPGFPEGLGSEPIIYLSSNTRERRITSQAFRRGYRPNRSYISAQMFRFFKPFCNIQFVLRGILERSCDPARTQRFGSHLFSRSFV